ncbi:MAG: hypothetical protein ACXACU_04215 [Candidatus Hodarchaeales archaeon]
MKEEKKGKIMVEISLKLSHGKMTQEKKKSRFSEQITTVAFRLR